MMAADEIVLSGLRAYGYHGVFQHERETGQEFVIDVSLQLSLLSASTHDDLTSTVHYGELAEKIVASVETEPVDLIETLAERIAHLTLSYPQVQQVTVTVHKPNAPIAVPFSDVMVRVHRYKYTRAVIAAGANLGDRLASIASAVRMISMSPGIELAGFAEPIETVALGLGGLDENAPRYLNTVFLVDTSLSPKDLHAVLISAENLHGRTRQTRWGDRTLDLDLICYGELVQNNPRLTLPHPRAHERDFVLQPWLSIDPEAYLPGHGRVSALLALLQLHSGKK